MCYASKNTAPKNQLEGTMGAKFDDGTDYEPSGYNAFEHPGVPIITNLEPHRIQLASWGLMPTWARDRDYQKFTLIARVEEIQQKKSYKDYVTQRCLILMTSFTDYQWLDPKGKKKQKYAIRLAGSEQFCVGGLWNVWIDPRTNESLLTYALLTRKAEGIMREIHNNPNVPQPRMPVVLSEADQFAWLAGEIDLPDPPELEAKRDSPEEMTLF